MYKIAVCDDEEFICTKIEQTMVHYGERYGLELKICVFYTGERLLQALQDAEGCFDLLFLDIGLRSMNGISVAEVIREKMGNEEMLIVYISGRQEYAMQLFKTRPMDFLVKPVSREELIAAFLKAKKLLDRGNEMLRTFIIKCRIVVFSIFKVLRERLFCIMIMAGRSFMIN